MNQLFAFIFAYIFYAIDGTIPGRQGRIVNGVSTIITTYPFSVAIRDQKTSKSGTVTLSDAWCGGSLLRKEYPAAVLTASHCIHGVRESLVVEMNATSTHQTPIIGVTAWPVLAQITHENYDSNTLDNDIAILFIDVDLSGAQHLSVVSLPTTDTSSCCTDGDPLEVIGYGRVSVSGSFSNALEISHVAYMSHRQCNRELCQYETGKTQCQWSYANDNNLCAIGTDTTPCFGDSGGPLLQATTSIQVGIVSWGFQCETHIPTVYTSTLQYMDWIQSKLNEYLDINSASVQSAIAGGRNPVSNDVSTIPVHARTNESNVAPRFYHHPLIPHWTSTTTTTTTLNATLQTTEVEMIMDMYYHKNTNNEYFLNMIWIGTAFGILFIYIGIIATITYWNVYADNKQQKYKSYDPIDVVKDIEADNDGNCTQPTSQH